MSRFRILDKAFHANGLANPFMLALVEDSLSDGPRLVVMFDDEDSTAVLSLDALLDEELSYSSHLSRGDVYDDSLREIIWSNSSDDDPHDMYL